MLKPGMAENSARFITEQKVEFAGQRGGSEKRGGIRGGERDSIGWVEREILGERVHRGRERLGKQAPCVFEVHHGEMGKKGL